MKLIAGLGNIGEKYCFTRHNAGFMVLDKWALNDGFLFKEETKLKCFFAKYDDIALDLGRIRFRANGSDGGHNGIKSIIQHVGTKNFDRLKIGIGPQPNIPSENYVLQNFPKENLPELKSVLTTSVEAVKYYLDNGIEKSQNKFN